jgi:DNA-binding ferritin-like protein
MYTTRNKTKYKHKRTQKHRKKNIKRLVYRLLQSLIIVKLYHWNTQSFSVHKATDELYEQLNSNIDKFIEVLLGKHKRINKNAILDFDSLKIKTYKTNNTFLKWLDKFKHYLIKVDSIFIPNEDSDILNIRDEILAELNKITYMLLLK